MKKATNKQISYIYYFLKYFIPESIIVDQDAYTSEVIPYYDDLLKKELTQSEATNLIQILLEIKNIFDFLILYNEEERKSFPEKLKILENLKKKFEEEFEKLRNKYLNKEASL